MSTSERHVATVRPPHPSQLSVLRKKKYVQRRVDAAPSITFSAVVVRYRLGFAALLSYEEIALARAGTPVCNACSGSYCIIVQCSSYPVYLAQQYFLRVFLGCVVASPDTRCHFRSDRHIQSKVSRPQTCGILWRAVIILKPEYLKHWAASKCDASYLGPLLATLIGSTCFTAYGARTYIHAFFLGMGLGLSSLLRTSLIIATRGGGSVKFALFLDSLISKYLFSC